MTGTGDRLRQLAIFSGVLQLAVGVFVVAHFSGRVSTLWPDATVTHWLSG